MAGTRIYWVVLILTVVAAPIGADDAKTDRRLASSKTTPDKDFQKAAAKFRQRAHGKKPPERIAALKILEEHPNVDAAGLVYSTLLADGTPDVRQAAIDFLAKRSDRGDVADLLLQRMTNATRKEGMDVRARGSLLVLAQSDDEDRRKSLLNYLDEFLGTPQANHLQLHSMIDELAGGEETAVIKKLLRFCLQAKYFDNNFGFRRCVVQGLIQVNDPECVADLIELLPRYTGQVRFDVVSYLRSVTGQNFGDDAARWRAWWAENRGQLEKLPRPQRALFDNYGQFREYYGIPLCADRMVFVLDTSLSMRGAKIEAAKMALIRAVQELKPDVFFDVIAFNGVARLWRPELVQASEENKRIAVNMVVECPLGYMTASYDALEAAFQLDPEAIYFLSDGEPVGGKIDVPADIVSTISTMNRVRRVSLHSIGIATTNSKRDVFGAFMKALAEKNWGLYKAVN